MIDEDRPSAISLRAMRDTDIEAASLLSKALGWPHRLEDWQFMFAAGHGLVAETPAGELVGTILWWTYGAHDASLGMVIVSGAWQGHGIGRRLMSGARSALPGRTLHLNATPVGIPLYEKLGFSPCGLVEQRQAIAATQPLIPLPEGMRLRPAGQSDLAALSALDHAATGMARQDLLHALLGAGRGIVVDDGGTIVGYSICRPFGWGNVIGPVIATTDLFASAMIAHWIGSGAGQFTRIDVPAACGLTAWLDEVGLPRVDTVTTMRTATDREGARGTTVFALCSQALG
ncbi:GCN5-related N-acetyltransferase [Gluconacetobacter diazotrophicus PA1 5]|uniref:GNAT family N-acetyltransferase n=1 Tax=Gluconacetobacter diazotrophicus TaxID=33996 RepID=A0A7W4I6X6_GLUDI|nr:GNAT family N-acetyltransferase [Gluconacetobacter diazotrophicus]ACI51367.1 GCN5-related N-acetyltransferase [Gluconacetobacter diazotrophicus PA1 5]MBB2157388.1 GNAT family N-acetyltransferase [Gluconacetobacter diazotrophicus]TWB09915.1 ribosomal protein S18 acetylase RimI-like enzyme [Gluconacetobacter diazotrophicus]